MIDLTKLAEYPAPWTYRACIHEHGIVYVINDGKADRVGEVYDEAIAQAICDWRNAFAVQVTQGLGSVKIGDVFRAIQMRGDEPDWRTPVCANDPTTAILAAAKWLEENK